ncbi:mucin-5AC-like [Pseudomyrmex gracilis]|uniref:mucin-5AC-like n=1 Tax=Pseudomyrmex gracilis TaxID=219809 RepID=UPI0009951FDA|nr:mucin-5AC-like [Pseudomyrmex gracilis]
MYPQKDVKLHIEKFHPPPPDAAEASPSKIVSNPGAAPSSAPSAGPTTNKKNRPAKNSTNPRQSGARSTTTANKKVRSALWTLPSGLSPTTTPLSTTKTSTSSSPTYAAVTAGQAVAITMRPPRATAAGTVSKPGPSKGAVPKRALTRTSMRTAAARTNTVADLSIPSSGGSSCIKRAGTSSLARRPPPHHHCQQVAT